MKFWIQMSIKVTLSLYILAVECRLIMHTEKDPKTDEKVKLHCHEYTDCDSCLSHSDITKNPCEWCASENRCLPYINFCPLPSRTQFTFNCPRPLEELPFYNETFARLYVLPMIASVYAANDSARDKCLLNHFDNIYTTDSYTISCGVNNLTKCHSFMAYLPDEDAIALLFQSEIDREFYMQQLNAMKNPKMIDLPAIGGALLMEYHDAFQRLWAMMRDDLYGALNYTNGTSDIWTFGHSFGGGLASIAAVVIATEGRVKSEKIKLYTFGQSRITDVSCAERHDKLVWYPHGMHRGSQYMISTMAEDGRASSSAISLSIFDNIMMFGRNLLDWSKNGCK